MQEMCFTCYAARNGDRWESICVDLDLAVEGASFDDVKGKMEASIRSYIEDASKEPPEVARRLIMRRAPWYVRLRLGFGAMLHVLKLSRRSAGPQANYDLLCHA